MRLRPASGRSAAHAPEVGFEDQGIFLPAAILDGLRERLSQVPFVPASGVVEGARMIKSPREIEYVRLAAAAAVAGIEAGFGAIRPGRTENEVAGAVYAAMVGAGSKSQLPAVRRDRAPLGARPRQLRAEGDQVGRHRIYGGRRLLVPLWWRDNAHAQRRPAFTRVAQGRQCGAGRARRPVAAVRPGVTSGEIDRAGRSVVEKAGLDQYWLHRTGYSDRDRFSARLGEGHIMDLKPGDPRPLQPGMTFHTVPMIGIPGLGAIRFSEPGRLRSTAPRC